MTGWAGDVGAGFGFGREAAEAGVAAAAAAREAAPLAISLSRLTQKLTSSKRGGERQNTYTHCVDDQDPVS